MRLKFFLEGKKNPFFKLLKFLMKAFSKNNYYLECKTNVSGETQNQEFFGNSQEMPEK